jgi:hypothetical protein
VSAEWLGIPPSALVPSMHRGWRINALPPAPSPSTEPHMNVVEFGTQLVVTGDLDPIYLMLNASDLSPDTTARWCLAYWMFYHAGVASRIAEHEGETFWAHVWMAQVNKWPRGTERRHFKAANSDKAIKYLEATFPEPEDAVAHLVGYNTFKDLVGRYTGLATSFAYVAREVQSWVGFGPWIAFKIADMLDAVIGVRVDFPQDSSVWFDDPVKGAVWAWCQEVGLEFESYWRDTTPAEKRATANKAIEEYLPELGMLVGPSGTPVRIQELETIFCKYKSHLNGHYPVGKDTREILLHQLPGWGEMAGQLQQALRDATPKEHHG